MTGTLDAASLTGSIIPGSLSTKFRELVFRFNDTVIPVHEYEVTVVGGELMAATSIIHVA